MLGGITLVLAVATAAGCGSAATPAATAIAATSPSPAATPSPSPTPPVVDHCVVGSWRATGGTVQWKYNGAFVIATGGAGTLTTYRADGSYSADFAGTRPYTGTSADGHHPSILPTGATSGTWTASAGQLELVSDHTTLVVNVTVDGTLSSSQPASKNSFGQYTCTTGKLTLRSGGFPTEYVPAG